jgi:ABC-2 type transport system ATP-binding protein
MTNTSHEPAAALIVEDVSLTLGARRILDHVSFAVGSGETVGLVGVNGAGKTSLIRGLLDLTRLDSGSVTIGGESHLSTSARCHCTYLAERFVPPNFATGAELLRHLLALHGQPFDRSRAEHEAHALELDPKALDRPARDYSKGMAQKIGLIACLLPAPQLLILDEPMSGLDPKARALFKRRLARVKEDGMAVFFSTHLLTDVEALCDRILLLDSGRICFNGTPAALMERTHAENLEQAFLSCLEALQAGPQGVA